MGIGGGDDSASESVGGDGMKDSSISEPSMVVCLCPVETIDTGLAEPRILNHYCMCGRINHFGYVEERSPIIGT